MAGTPVRWNPRHARQFHHDLTSQRSCAGTDLQVFHQSQPLSKVILCSRDLNGCDAYMLLTLFAVIVSQAKRPGNSNILHRNGSSTPSRAFGGAHAPYITTWCGSASCVRNEVRMSRSAMHWRQPDYASARHARSPLTAHCRI